MITAAISTLLGLVGGSLPDILKLVSDRSESKLEMDRIKLETAMAIQLAKAKADLRMNELALEADAKADDNYGKQLQSLYKLQSQQTGIKWIDGFNSIIRPLTAALAMSIAFTLIAAQGYVILSEIADHTVTLETGINIMWNGFVGEVIQAVLGWMFGYRSARKTIVRR